MSSSVNLKENTQPSVVNVDGIRCLDNKWKKPNLKRRERKRLYSVELVTFVSFRLLTGLRDQGPWEVLFAPPFSSFLSDTYHQISLIQSFFCVWSVLGHRMIIISGSNRQVFTHSKVERRNNKRPNREEKKLQDQKSVVQRPFPSSATEVTLSWPLFSSRRALQGETPDNMCLVRVAPIDRDVLGRGKKGANFRRTEGW